MPTCTWTATASRRSSSADNAGGESQLFLKLSTLRRSHVQTIHPTTTARRESRTRRRRRVVAACIAALLLAGGGVKLWLDHRVPLPDADAGRLSRYMASPAFAALPDARRAPYLDAFRRANDRGELTPEQQRGVMSNVRMD